MDINLRSKIFPIEEIFMRILSSLYFVIIARDPDEKYIVESYALQCSLDYLTSFLQHLLTHLLGNGNKNNKCLSSKIILEINSRNNIKIAKVIE